MADSHTARIFQEMRDADSLRADMREGIMARTQDALSDAYGSALAASLVSGLQDTYRRGIEQGWFGQDVFDGRWQAEQPTPSLDATAQGYGQQFYGVEREHEQDTGLER